MKKKYLISFGLAMLIIATYIAIRVALCNYIDYIADKHTPRSNIPVDVVLVANHKDFELVPYSISSIRKFLKQPIKKAVLISPKTPQAISLAKALNMEFVDEDSLLKFGEFKNWVKENNIKHTHPGVGWYYQQFIKLLYSKISSSEYYFIVDADIVMNRPFILVSNDKIHTFFVGENHAHEVSKTSIKRLLGEQQYVPDFSYIADLMCFNKDITEQMLAEIETKNGQEFHKSAMLAEHDSKARFSEYELYGAYANHRDEKTFVNYLPSVYASTDYLRNYLESYHFLSNGHTRRRYCLLCDRYNPALKAYPYIAYHHWVKDSLLNKLP